MDVSIITGYLVKVHDVLVNGILQTASTVAGSSSALLKTLFGIATQG